MTFAIVSGDKTLCSFPAVPYNKNPAVHFLVNSRRLESTTNGDVIQWVFQEHANIATCYQHSSLGKETTNEGRSWNREANNRLFAVMSAMIKYIFVAICCVVLCSATSSFENSAVENGASTMTGSMPKALPLRRRLLEDDDAFFVPFPSGDPNLPVVSPTPGCIRQTSVGLCILPKAPPEDVRVFAEELLDEKTAFAVGILLDLGVNFTIDNDGITFRLANRVSCNISTSESNGSRVSVRTTAIASSTGVRG